MPTLFTDKKNAKRSNKLDEILENTTPDDNLFISHITIYRSGIMLAIYLIVLELIFLLAGLLIRLPLGFFISTLGPDTLFTVNTSIIVAFEIIKIVFMLIIISQWLENYYEVRPGKIIYKAGLLKREEKEFDCPDVAKVILSQGFFGRLFKFGTITLYLRNLNDTFSLSNIPNPHRNLKLIEKALVSKSVAITLTDDLSDYDK